MTTTTYELPNTSFVPYSTTAKQGIVAVALPLMLLTAGTGGVLTTRSAEQLGRWLHAPSIQVERPCSRKALDSRSPAEHVSFIRDIFGLNMSELASVLGVTRPTAYAWIQGQEPKSDAILQIQALSQTAENVDKTGIIHVSRLIRRPIFSGESLLDMLKAKKDISSTLTTLKELALKEQAARRTPKGSGKHKSTFADISAELSTPLQV